MKILQLALLASLACAGGAVASEQGRASIGCAEISAVAINGIKERLAGLKVATSSEDSEQLEVELGSLFEKYPCGLVEEAIRGGFKDKQIASFVSSLGPDFVDRPCESRDRLLARLSMIDGLEQPGLKKSIGELVQPSVERDSRECERDNRK